MIEKSHAQKNTEEVIRPAHSSVDEVIVFKQLRDKTSLGIMIDIDDNTAIKQATGSIFNILSDIQNLIKKFHSMRNQRKYIN